MARIVDYKDLPDLIAVSARGVKRAGMNTLNDVAFKTLKPMVAQADSDMSFRSNARRALGWQVEKATMAKLESQVLTKRGWFAFHADEGNRNASGRGLLWKGQSWIFVPRAKSEGVVDKRGRLRKSAGKGLYLTPRGDHALVFYRARKGAKDSEFVGVAVKQAAFHKDTDWDKVIEAEWRNSATTIMRRNLKTRLNHERSK